MRFQQLKRDPNSVVKKRLVKSKKSWVVVTGLSFAGGLLMLATPSYIAKAEVTATTTASTIATTNKSNNTVASLEKPTSTLSVTKFETGKKADLTVKTGESKNQVLDRKPVVPKSVEKEPIETSAPVETSDKPNDSSIQSKSLKQTINPKDISKPIAKPTENNVISESKIKEDKDVSHSEHESTDSVIIDAATGKEKVVKKADSGNGWVVVDSGKTLNIVGKLDEGNGHDHERWGGHTQEITTININNALTAPKDSSYLFANMTNLTKVNNLKNLNTEEVENAEGMFKNDSKLEHLDLSVHSFRPAKNISHMFENDSKLKTITFGSSAFKNIVDGSYAFANDISLTDFTVVDKLHDTSNLSATNSWTATYATDLRSMFKNDSSLKTLNLYTWNFRDADTGSSFEGTGMFDGTDLSEIVLNKRLKFSESTALTSSHGYEWTGVSGVGENSNFYGVPTFDKNGRLTEGIAKIFNGKSKSYKADVNYVKYVAKENTVASGNTVIPNLVKVETNVGDISIPVNGTVGSKVELPNRVQIGNQTYQRVDQNAPAKVIVNQSVGEIESNENVNYILEKTNGEEPGSVEEPENPTDTPAPTEPENPTDTPAPTEPENPTDTPAPTEPENPTDTPAKSNRHTSTTEPENPTDTPAPTEPENPTDTPAPTEPENPTDTPAPTEPENPTDTPAPTEPENPTDTPAPTEPENPTDTPAPTEPENPTDTPAPTEPENPTDTPAPTEPENPTDTPAPTEPENPTDTPAPTEPENPTDTPAPTEPTNPMEKPQAGHTAEPAEPETPVTPALPDQNVHNTKPQSPNTNASNNHSVKNHHSNFQSNQYIAAYKKKSGVEIYTLNQMNNLEKVPNTELDPVINEKGVSIIDIQGTKYYRLSNNRLIRIADAYIYTPVNLSAKAHPDKYINIFTAEGYLIRSEKLANIILNIDAFTYINGEKYYRISNNEFVRAIDVTLY
ncbi:BspA family leucine-rich repeat surface protein [Companilactobacillus zhachilii]|uniref:BspA family leucine-rich repeat surface protein n=1 Tax=Companilactobacillus zhachilii TaxID=2304606 RepID=A0A386PU49_9LACO|nr:BspA family leucine-rich repeat surface protein [Companilactobacillus zhachilii]AYE39012.1 BspA family leucine-rich repeat surface protein [Companilactobacillus zhachilii]